MWNLMRKRQYIFFPVLVIFFRGVLMTEAVDLCWKQGLKGCHFHVLFKINQHVRSEIVLFFFFF